MKTKVTLEYLGNTLFPAPRPRLENDPMCGLTTGGSSECFWDCEYVSDPNFGSIISNLECLLDCFEEVTFIEFLKLLDKVSGHLPAQFHSRLHHCWWNL